MATQEYNMCRLMADQAMQNRDYKAQLERSAYSQDKPEELSELNVWIEKDMAALRHKHLIIQRGLYLRRPRLSGQTFQSDEDRMTYLIKIGEASVEEDERLFKGTASASAHRALAVLAANQIIQGDPHPFQFMKLSAELRGQVYQELFIGGGRTISVYADRESKWWRSCKTEGPSVHGKDITTALLRTNRRLYEEALPVLYQSHAFDFGIDVQNIAPFFDKTSTLARQNVHCIHVELLRHGIDPPLRSGPVRMRVVNDNCLAWSDACAYIARHLQVKEISFNINFAIPQDFQRFRWVKDLAQMRGVRKISHHNSPDEHGLKSSEASILLANQKSRPDWGTDEYRWEVLTDYLTSEMS